MNFKRSLKTKAMCFSMSYIIYYFMRGYVNLLLFNLLYKNLIWTITNNLIADILIFFIILMIPINMVHEWCHGILLKAFGGQVKYQWKGIYMQAQEVSKVPIHRTKFLMVLLLPVTVISIFAKLIPGWLGGVVLILNLFKSTEDVLKAFYLLKGNSDTYLIYKEDGYEMVDNSEEAELTLENAK
ncbi:MAG: DUF3267 domain-containing protein [Clostridiales bacterium]|nr:DUF3267 domain-containing protein [Clostridiales bacterium]